MVKMDLSVSHDTNQRKDLDRGSKILLIDFYDVLYYLNAQ